MSQSVVTMPAEELESAARLHARAGDVPGVPTWLLFVASLIPAILVFQIAEQTHERVIGFYVGVMVALVAFLLINHYLEYRRLRRSRADWVAKLTWLNDIEGEDAVRSALIWSENAPIGPGVPRLNNILTQGQLVADYLTPAKNAQLIAAITDRENWHVLLRIADLARNDFTDEGAPAGWDPYTAFSFPEIVDAILKSDFDPRTINDFQTPMKRGTLANLKDALSQPVQV